MTIYSGPELTSAKSLAASVSHAHTLTSGGLRSAVGLSAFSLPQTEDFYIYTTVSLSSTIIQLTIDLQANTVVYTLTYDYLIMIRNSNIFTSRRAGKF